MESFVHLFKGGRFQRQRLWLPCAQGEIPFLHKAQEGRRNSPVDCFGVGNPRRGFPESRRRRDFVLIFSPVYVIQEMSRYRSCKEKIFYTTSAKPIPALKRKDYRTLPTRFGVPAAPRFGARRPAPGICNSRNEPIPVLQRKDFLHYLREADTGLKKKRLPHTAYAIRCARGTSVRCTAARARYM